MCIFDMKPMISFVGKYFCAKFTFIATINQLQLFLNEQYFGNCSGVLATKYLICPWLIGEPATPFACFVPTPL